MEQVSIPLPLNVEALLFDLDDTLYDRDLAYLGWATSFVGTHFPATSGAHAQEIIDKLVFFDEHEDTPRDILFTQLLQRYPILDVLIKDLVEEYYRDFPQYITPLKETEELLDRLVTASIPFGIITNGSIRQKLKIELLGLNRRTSCIFISHLFGKEKPDASIFLAAADHLQMQPEKILFIGDNPYNDIWGAHQAGMRTAWLQRAHPWPPDLPHHIADMTLHSFSDLFKDPPRQWVEHTH